MTYPTRLTAQEAFSTIHSLLRQVKLDTTNLLALANGGTADAESILSYLERISSYKATIASMAEVPGVATFAQSALGEGALNIGSEFLAVSAAIDSLIAWVAANFPKDANGYLLAQTLNAQGQRVSRVFSAASLSTFRTALQGLLNTLS
jgi:hypothetical protein